MKRAGFIIGLFFFLCHLTLTVKAEGLNQYELEVIEEAKKFFEVDGVTYQVKNSYIKELTSYLSTEIDLTKEQKDKVLHTMHSNVEIGIKEGYLQIVEAKQEEPIEESESQTNDDSPQESNSQDKVETPPLVEEAIGSGPKSGTTDEPQNKNPEEADTKMNSDTKTKVVKTDSTITVSDSNDDTVLTLNVTIKNTGFSLENTILTLLLIGIIIIMAFIVTCQYGLFAHNNE